MKTKRPRIKRLELDFWMNPDFFDFDECIEHGYEITDPIIGKPGRYFQNGVEWFETTKGTAYKPKTSEGFQYELDLLNVQQNFNSQQIAALRSVIKQKVCTEEQRKIVRLYDQFLQIRNTGRNIRIHLMRD